MACKAVKLTYTDKSRGTDAFIAEFDRLAAKCLQAVVKESGETARQSFEILYSLLSQIDEEPILDRTSTGAVHTT